MTSPAASHSYTTLSDREKVVLRLMADGMSNRDIAAELWLSENTVKWYVQQVYQKLQVRRRTQAVAAARSHGLLAGGDSSAELPSPAAIPRPLTPLIGREQELSELRRLLDSPLARLVTITGPGGVGKTRLALAVATRRHEQANGEVCFVSLETLTSADEVAVAIGRALGIRFGGAGDLVAQLRVGLRPLKLLLLLDNVEHLLPETALLAANLLESAPGLTILATSRERLNLRAETVFNLGGLSYPPEGHPSANHSAVQLFVEAARRARYGFEVDGEGLDCVGRICRLIEGLPLAIEIAAAWVEVLSLEQIAAEITHNLETLSLRARDVPDRHKTIQAVFDHSWKLLSEEERGIFKRLAVFRGGFDLAAARTVAGATPFQLSALVDKSLVVPGIGAARYSVHELLRQYALSHLAHDAEAADIHARHAAWFLELAETAEAALVGSDQLAWLTRLEAEHENLRAAMSWSLAQPAPEIALRISGALRLFWGMRGYYAEGRSWLNSSLAAAGDAPAAFRARALRGRAYLAWLQTDYDDAHSSYQQALELYRQVELPDGVAACLNGLATLAFNQTDYQGARALYEESLAILRALNHRVLMTIVIGNLANLARIEGEYERSQALAEESLALAHEVGRRDMIGQNLHNLAMVALQRGEVAQARKLGEESLAILYELGLKRYLLHVIEGFACLAVGEGRPLIAARLFGAVEALRESFGLPMSSTDRQFYAPTIAQARSQCDQAAFSAAWAEGRRLSLEQALDQIRADTPAW